MNKQLVTRAFEELGPERVERGMRAFGDPKAPGNAERCFLGCAVNLGFSWRDLLLPPLVLIAQVGGKLHWDWPVMWTMRPAFRLMYRIHGLSACAVADAFDSKFTRPQLRELAREWLETNRSNSIFSTSTPAATSVPRAEHVVGV
jgi:hypothetical protein